MGIQKINDKPYEVDDILKQFEIYKKPSSNVDAFGIHSNGRFFIQFKNSSFIFDGVPIDILKEAVSCESIGKFFHANIRGKFESHKIDELLVREVADEN